MKIPPRIAFAIPIAIVIIAGFVFQFFGLIDFSEKPQQQINKPADYYVMLSLIEATAAQPDGSAWDTGNSSAPDLYYEIYWRGVRVFKSSTKEDSLLAKWSNAEIDLRELALSGKNISPDEAIKGARIAVHPDETIDIKIFDSDTLSADELVGTLSIKTSDLKPGDTTFRETGHGLVRAVVRVLDMSQPPDLLK